MNPLNSNIHNIKVQTWAANPPKPFLYLQDFLLSSLPNQDGLRFCEHECQPQCHTHHPKHTSSPSKPFWDRPLEVYISLLLFEECHLLVPWGFLSFFWYTPLFSETIYRQNNFTGTFPFWKFHIYFFLADVFTLSLEQNMSSFKISLSHPGTKTHRAWSPSVNFSGDTTTENILPWIPCKLVIPSSFISWKHFIFWYYQEVHFTK